MTFLFCYNTDQKDSWSEGNQKPHQNRQNDKSKWHMKIPAVSSQHSFCSRDKTSLLQFRFYLDTLQLQDEKGDLLTHLVQSDC